MVKSKGKAWKEGKPASYIRHPMHGCVIEGYVDIQSFRVMYGTQEVGRAGNMAEAIKLAKSKNIDEANVLDDPDPVDG